MTLSQFKIHYANHAHFIHSKQEVREYLISGKINGHASLSGATDIIITEFQVCKTGKNFQKKDVMSIHHKQL